MDNQEFYQGSYYNGEFTNEKGLCDSKNVDHFIVDDLLDFPNDDGMVTAEDTPTNTPNTTMNGGGNSTNSSIVTVVGTSCNSPFSSSIGAHITGGDTGCRNVTDGQFSSELCVPYDDLAELEWLSSFVEESFSSEDLQKLHLISGIKAQNGEPSRVDKFQPEPSRANSNPMFRSKMSVPAKARSKRSRAAPCNWTSRLLVVSSPTNSTITPTTPAIAPPATMSSSSESDIIGKKTIKATIRKKESFDDVGGASGGDGRKCLHCATDKTPQWRTGPMGPKTLCNACGVRYKSGRLVPEYRPAASPTFMLTKHSNSHRKVLEIRRQKEMSTAQQHHQQLLQQSMVFDISNNNDDYLIHQHVGPDYRQLRGM